jgi:DNA-binding protein Fis
MTMPEAALPQDDADERVDALFGLLPDDTRLTLRRDKGGTLRLSIPGVRARLPLVVVDAQEPDEETVEQAESFARRGRSFVVLITPGDPDPEVLYWAYSLKGCQVVEVPPERSGSAVRRLECLVCQRDRRNLSPEPPGPSAPRQLGRGPLSRLSPGNRPRAVANIFQQLFEEWADELGIPLKSLSPSAVELLVNRLHSRKLTDFRRLSRDLTVRWTQPAIDRHAVLEFEDGHPGQAGNSEEEMNPLRRALFTLLNGQADSPFSEEAFQQAPLGLERAIISMALAHARGTQTRAAQLLGITRSTLQTRLKQLGLDPNAFKRTNS